MKEAPLKGTVLDVENMKWFDYLFCVTVKTELGDIRYISQSEKRIGQTVYIKKKQQKRSWDPITWEEC